MTLEEQEQQLLAAYRVLPEHWRAVLVRLTADIALNVALSRPWGADCVQVAIGRRDHADGNGASIHVVRHDPVA